MEARRLKIQFLKSGSGSISARLSIPKLWLDLFNINKESKDVVAILDEEEGRIIIRKMKEYEKGMSNAEIEACIDNVNASMEIEGYEVIPEEDNDARKILRGECTADKLIMEKFQKYKGK